MMYRQEKRNIPFPRIFKNYDLGNIIRIECFKNLYFIHTPDEKFVLRCFDHLKLALQNIRVLKFLDARNYFKTKLLVPAIGDKFIVKTNSNYFFICRHLTGETFSSFVQKNKITKSIICNIVDSVHNFHNLTKELKNDFEFQNFSFHLPIAQNKRIITETDLKLYKLVKKMSNLLNFPKTVIHGDLNETNIIVNKKGIFFIDFDEVALGPPLIDIASALISIIFKGDEISYENISIFIKRYGSLCGTEIRKDVMEYFFHLLRFWLFKYNLYFRERDIQTKEETAYADMITSAYGFINNIDEKIFLKNLISARENFDNSKYSTLKESFFDSFRKGKPILKT